MWLLVSVMPCILFSFDLDLVLGFSPTHVPCKSSRPPSARVLQVRGRPVLQSFVLKPPSASFLLLGWAPLHTLLCNVLCSKFAFLKSISSLFPGPSAWGSGGSPARQTLVFPPLCPGVGGGDDVTCPPEPALLLPLDHGPYSYPSCSLFVAKLHSLWDLSSPTRD